MVRIASVKRFCASGGKPRSSSTPRLPTSPLARQRQPGPSWSAKDGSAARPSRMPCAPGTRVFESSTACGSNSPHPPQRLRDLGCRRRASVRHLIQHTNFGERKWAVQVSLAEQPDLPRIKTIEPANLIHLLHIASVNELLDHCQLSVRDSDGAVTKGSGHLSVFFRLRSIQARQNLPYDFLAIFEIGIYQLRERNRLRDPDPARHSQFLGRNPQQRVNQQPVQRHP